MKPTNPSNESASKPAAVDSRATSREITPGKYSSSGVLAQHLRNQPASSQHSKPGAPHSNYRTSTTHTTAGSASKHDSSKIISAGSTSGNYITGAQSTNKANSSNGHHHHDPAAKGAPVTGAGQSKHSNNAPTYFTEIP